MSLYFTAFVISETVLVFLSSLSILPLPPIEPLPHPRVMTPFGVVKLSASFIGFLARPPLKYLSSHHVPFFTSFLTLESFTVGVEVPLSPPCAFFLVHVLLKQKRKS